MNLVNQLEIHAREQPSRVAIIEKNRQITFGELWKRVRGGAEQLQQFGLKKGDAILVIHPIQIELYEVLLSAFHNGIVVVLLDPAKGAGFLDECLEWFPVQAYFGSAKAHLLRLKSRKLRKVQAHFHSGSWLPLTIAWKPSRETSQVESLAPDAPALVTFTSGSTGKPKGVVRSHGFLLAQDQALGASLKLQPGQIDLVTLPVFLLTNLSHGITSVIADTDLTRPGSPDCRGIQRQVCDFNVTRGTASPAFFENLPDSVLVRLSQIFTGGAPVFLDLLDRFNHLGIDATVVYGSTEAEPISHFGAHELTERHRQKTLAGGGLPVGVPVPEIHLRIIEDQKGAPISNLTRTEFDNLRREVGEIVVSGDHVLSGYLSGRGDEETKFSVDGTIWHRTGDAGRIAGDGCLWLLGRVHAKWRDLYPLQIEAAVRVLKPGWRCAFYQGLLIVEEAPADLEDALPWAEGLSIVQVEKIPMDQRHNAKVDYPRLEILLKGGRC